MSQQQDNNQSRSNNSYPSPSSYASPAMNAYSYPPPSSGQNVEPYRASPTGSNMSLPGVNTLAPLRTGIDGRTQQHHQQSSSNGQQQLSGQNPPLPPPHMNQFYQPQYGAGPPQQHSSSTPDPNQQPQRFQLPPQDAKMMSGGRHKKEIKRRTKTGCLTCRKRRIKCDEAHPVCRNCLKSKRECAGYDPIFKPQPGPAAIQPAPSSAPSMQATPATSSQYPAPPQGYVPAGSQPYGSDPMGGANSPGSSAEPYEYNQPAIDPALEGAGTSQMQVPFPSYNGTDLRQGVAKPTKIEELLTIGGVPAPEIPKSAAFTQSTLTSIKDIYSTVYAIGIDKFFETRWFTTRGYIHLLKDSQLCEDYAALLSRVRMPNAGEGLALNSTRSLEATVIWHTMCLCRKISAAVSENVQSHDSQIDVDEGVHDACKRLKAFETLVTNQYLDEELFFHQSTPPRNGTMLDDTLRNREREFWRLIGKFVTLHDDEASSAKEIDDTLGALRLLLDSRENRDVLYSIAIVRHLGQRLAESSVNQNMPPRTDRTDESEDPRSKLYVAREFLIHESTSKATTQVVGRICGMAMKSWNGVR